MVIKGSFDPIDDISKILELRESINWVGRSVKVWKEIIRKSSHIYYLYDDEKLIGMGRCVEDGVMFMIYDLVVRKEYQNQGNGTKIMNALLDKTKDKNYTMIGLFSDNDEKIIRFYQSFGFKKSNGMAIFNF